MGKIAWYKRDPRAALTGMMELTLEERGAYNTVLDLIYDRDGELPDDDRFLAGWCKCDLRVWKRIRQRLIDLGKLYVDGGKLRNERADRGVDEALHRVASAAEAGRASGRKRAPEGSKPNGLARTVAPTVVATNIEDRSKKEDKGESPLKPPRNKRDSADCGSFLPKDWTPSEADRDYARQKGFTDVEIDGAAEEFRLHWLSASGPEARKRNWSAAWQKRILNLIKFGRGPSRATGGNGGGGGGDRRAGDRQAGRVADTLAVLHRRGSLGRSCFH